MCEAPSGNKFNRKNVSVYFAKRTKHKLTLTISMATKQAMVVFQSLSKDAFPTSKL